MESSNQTVKVTEFIFLSFTKSNRFSALLFTLFLLIYLIIIGVNLFMLLVIKFDIRLHTPMYFFVFSLSFLDICYTNVIVPQILCNLLGSRASILFYHCATQMFFSVHIGAVQIFIITAMAYDRYVAISNPLRYKTVMTWAVCGMLLGIAWVITFMIAFTMVYCVFTMPFCSRPEVSHFFCDVGQVLFLTCADIPGHWFVELTTFLLGLGLFTIPFLLVVASYIYIISAIMKIRTTEGRLKAFSTCSSHITVVIVEYGCLGFIYFRPNTSYSLDKDRVFVLTFMFMSPILNPLIYSIRNKAVNEGFKKLASQNVFSRFV